MLKIGRTVTWLRGVKAALEGHDLETMPPIRCPTASCPCCKTYCIKSAIKQAHFPLSMAENRERVHLDNIIAPVKVDTKAAQLRQIAAGACTL